MITVDLYDDTDAYDTFDFYDGPLERVVVTASDSAVGVATVSDTSGIATVSDVAL